MQQIEPKPELGAGKVANLMQEFYQELRYGVTAYRNGDHTAALNHINLAIVDANEILIAMDNSVIILDKSQWDANQTVAAIMGARLRYNKEWQEYMYEDVKLLHHA